MSTSIILFLLVGYFIFGYIVTIIKIQMWRRLISMKASYKLKNLRILDIILCFIIFPYQFFIWITKTKFVGKFFPIIPITNILVSTTQTRISINESVIEGLNTYMDFGYSNPVKTGFVKSYFEKDQFLTGIFLGYLHVFGYVLTIMGYLLELIIFISKFLYNKIIEPFLLLFYIK